MTQRDLAAKVDVGVPYISKIEAGRENPSDGLIIRFAEHLDLDPDELFLVARRLPPEIAEAVAQDPKGSLEFFRTITA